MLLLDEPLGALDARLRKDLQVELKALQAELGITFVFVTHDQEEALTMSDRVAVMSGGRVEQAGTPREIYEEPATEFVADFLGVSNLLTADASGDGDGCALRVGERTLKAASGATSARGDVKAMIRPERVGVEPQGTEGDNRLPGLVERAVYVGSAYELHVRLVGGSLLKATIMNDGTPFAYEEGTPVTLYLPPDAVRVLTPSPSPGTTTGPPSRRRARRRQPPGRCGRHLPCSRRPTGRSRRRRTADRACRAAGRPASRRRATTG